MRENVRENVRESVRESVRDIARDADLKAKRRQSIIVSTLATSMRAMESVRSIVPPLRGWRESLATFRRMTSSPIDSTLLALLPTDAVGAIAAISPIQVGLSGARVWAVTTDRGEFILRVQSASAGIATWTQHLLVLRRAADAGIAPPVVHVDEDARAVVSVRIAGSPIAGALLNPSQRGSAISSVVAQVRALHELDASDVKEVDAAGYARAVWSAQRSRPGFPEWTTSVPALIDRAALTLGQDRRRVVGHNDLNPGNILWDGTKAWFVDWEAAGLAHPYYDMATFTTFLNLDSETSSQLLTMQEQRKLEAEDLAVFATLKQLMAVAIGCTFLGLVPALTPLDAATADDAPTLAECYAGMGAGRVDLQRPSGQKAFGLAFLRLATTSG